VDASGNFWVFGGYNLSPTGQPNAFNDLWEFSAGQWKWASGANVVNQTGTYGTQGTAATGNNPGARWSMASWTDQDVLGNTRLATCGVICHFQSRPAEKVLGRARTDAMNPGG
jgi:hypothetical protein